VKVGQSFKDTNAMPYRARKWFHRDRNMVASQDEWSCLRDCSYEIEDENVNVNERVTGLIRAE
jgi:hypothetical protein